VFRSLLLFLFCTLSSLQLKAQCLPADQIPNQYIIRLKKVSTIVPNQSLSAKSLQNIQISRIENDLKNRTLSFQNIFSPKNIKIQNSFVDNKSVNPSSPPHTLVIKTKNIFDLAFLQSHLDIETVEQDCRLHLFNVNSPASTPPNDPMYLQQWALEKIKAPQAWQITKGKNDVIVGISDTGVDYLHEDLNVNMWINPDETPNNGIDDDRNGCIDDIHGCDLAEDNGQPMPPPTSRSHSHGTHVAGIVGAATSNFTGIAGTAPGIKLMALKGFKNNLDGITDGSDLLKTIYYAVNNGARVINCSWGRKGTPTSAELDAIKYAIDNGVTIVAAAGNSNLDSSSFTPASIPGVITVGASDSNDQIASFSNWGTRVDIIAPGGKGFDAFGNMEDPILSTLPRSQGMYGNFIGTSMSAPYVAGAAALILSINSNLTPADVLSILKLSGDMVHVRTSGGKEFDYPRLNLYNAVRLAQTTTPSSSSNNGSSGNNGGSNSQSSSQLTQPTSSAPATNKNGGCNLSSSRQIDYPTGSLLLLLLPLGLITLLKKYRPN